MQYPQLLHGALCLTPFPLPLYTLLPSSALSLPFFVSRLLRVWVLLYTRRHAGRASCAVFLFSNCVTHTVLVEDDLGPVSLRARVGNAARELRKEGNEAGRHM